MKRIVSLLCVGLFLVVSLLAPHAACGAAPGETPTSSPSVGPEERRTYTVNEEYLEQKAAEEAARPSMLIEFIKLHLGAEQGLLHKLYFLLYMLLPFAILGVSLWIELTRGWENLQKLFLLGLSEFLFSIGNAGMGAGVFPWFCDYDLVGWIVTIVCFCYMLRILVKQGLFFLGFVGGCCGDNRLKRLLFYVMYSAIAFSVTALFAAKSFFWLAPIVVAGVWYYFYRCERMVPAQATRTLWYSGVIFGGFLIFFLQVIGMILIVALLFFLLQGFASIKTSPVSMERGGGSAQGDNLLERSADGTPFVHHPDGSTTQLRDLGDGNFEGPDGTPWKDNGSGHLFR